MEILRLIVIAILGVVFIVLLFNIVVVPIVGLIIALMGRLFGGKDDSG